MNLDWVRLSSEHYAEYQSWFADPELDAHLGPMDQDWLDAVLAEREEDGVIWAVLEDDSLVAVAEVGLDPDHESPAVIRAIATKPSLKRRGIARDVLHEILLRDHARGIREHQAIIRSENTAARRLAEAEGFRLISDVPDSHGYLRYSHVRGSSTG